MTNNNNPKMISLKELKKLISESGKEPTIFYAEDLRKGCDNEDTKMNFDEVGKFISNKCEKIKKFETEMFSNTKSTCLSPEELEELDSECFFEEDLELLETNKERMFLAKAETEETLNRLKEEYCELEEKIKKEKLGFIERSERIENINLIGLKILYSEHMSLFLEKRIEDIKTIQKMVTFALEMTKMTKNNEETNDK